MTDLCGEPHPDLDITCDKPVPCYYFHANGEESWGECPAPPVKVMKGGKAKLDEMAGASTPGERRGPVTPEERQAALEGDRGGVTFSHEFDFERLNEQMKRVYRAIEDGEWRSLREISIATGDPEASVSARIRDLRKPQFGSLSVSKRRVGDPERGYYEYRLDLA